MARRGAGRAHGSWAIAGTFIGTVVGAGFASGQETLRFFTAFGPAGLLGLALATVLFVGFGVRMLSLGRELRATSHRPLIYHAVGARLGPAFDVLLAVFFLATAAAMASGAASTVSEQFGGPRWLGAALMMMLSAWTVLGGVRGVVAAISAIAPLLIGAILVISVYSLATGDPVLLPENDTASWANLYPSGNAPVEPHVGTASATSTSRATTVSVTGLRAGLAAALAWRGAPELAAVRFWWSGAALYVAYNMLLAVTVLAPLGARAKGGAVFRGGLLGGLSLGISAAAIHLAIAAHMPEAAQMDIPMLHTARALAPWVSVTYSLLLLAEIYTTTVAMLFGFAARHGEEGEIAFRRAVLLGAFAAFLGGQLAFADIVGVLYPVMGVIGLLLLGGLLRRTGRS